MQNISPIERCVKGILPLILLALLAVAGCGPSPERKQDIPPRVADALRLKQDLDRVAADLDRARAAATRTVEATRATAQAVGAAREVTQELEQRGRGAETDEVHDLYVRLIEAEDRACRAMNYAKAVDNELTATRQTLADTQAHERKQDGQISLLEAQRDELLAKLKAANDSIGRLQDAEKKARSAAMLRLIVLGTLIGVAGLVLAFAVPGGRTIGGIIAVAGGALVGSAWFVSWMLDQEWIPWVVFAGVLLFVLYKLGVFSWVLKRTVGAVEQAEPGRAADKPEGVKAALADSLGAASGLFTRTVDAVKKQLAVKPKAAAVATRTEKTP